MSEVEKVADCCVCFVAIYAVAGFNKQRREDCKPFWCPNGHEQTFTRARATAIEQRDRARQDLEQERKMRAKYELETQRLKRKLARVSK